MLIWAIITFVIVLSWDIITDYIKWKKHIPVNHKKEAIIRAFLLAPTIYCLLFPLKFVGLGDFLFRLTFSLMLVFSIWWELFDGVYNKLRGFKWRFNGSVDPDDSILDKFLYKIGDFWEGILKWSLIILSSIGYYYGME